MPKSPDNSSEPSRKVSEELGWDFNNEIGFTMLEIEELRRAKTKFTQDSVAIDQRLESLDAIKKYIHNKK